jgi:hypothetical protein
MTARHDAMVAHRMGDHRTLKSTAASHQRPDGRPSRDFPFQSGRESAMVGISMGDHRGRPSTIAADQRDGRPFPCEQGSTPRRRS